MAIVTLNNLVSIYFLTSIFNLLPIPTQPVPNSSLTVQLPFGEFSVLLLLSQSGEPYHSSHLPQLTHLSMPDSMLPHLTCVYSFMLFLCICAFPTSLWNFRAEIFVLGLVHSTCQGLTGNNQQTMNSVDCTEKLEYQHSRTPKREWTHYLILELHKVLCPGLKLATRCSLHSQKTWWKEPWKVLWRWHHSEFSLPLTGCRALAKTLL